MCFIFLADGTVKYNCTICEKTFKSKKNCFYHLTCSGDATKKPLLCDKCNKSFKIQSHLDYHMLTHTGNTYTDESQLKIIFSTRWPTNSFWTKINIRASYFRISSIFNRYLANLFNYKIFNILVFFYKNHIFIKAFFHYFLMFCFQILSLFNNCLKAW